VGEGGSNRAQRLCEGSRAKHGQDCGRGVRNRGWAGGEVRVDAYQLPRGFEGAEIRDGRLMVRVKGGEEVVLGEPTDLKWKPPRAEKWYSFPLESFKEVLRFAGWKRER